MSSFYSRLQLLLYGLLFLVTPFIISSESVDITLAPRLLFLAAILVFLSLVGLGDGSGGSFYSARPSHQGYLFVAIIGYLAIVCLSCLASFNIGESLYESGKRILPFVLLLLLIQSLKREPTKLPGLLSLTVTIAALAVGLVGIAQLYSLAFLDLPGNVIPYATMANRNLFASFLVLSLPFALITARSELRIKRGLGVVTTAVIIFTIVVSQTRAVWVALAIAGLSALVLAIATRSSRSVAISGKQSAGKSGGKKIIILSVLVVAAVIALSNSTQEWKLTDRMKSIVSREDGSISDRLDIWSRSFGMVADHPMIGVGPGQWRVQIAGYGVEGTRSESGVTHFQRPHNDFLWVLCESGSLALLFYLTIFAFAGWKGWQKLKRPSGLDQYWRILFCLFGLIAYLAVSFFSYPQERITHQMLLMALMALLVADLSGSDHTKREKRIGSATVTYAVLALFSMIVLIMALSRFGSEKEMQQIYRWRDLDRWSEMIAATERAESFITVMDPTAAPLSWYRGVGQFSLGDKEGAFRSFLRAYEINPNHLHVLNNLGTSYQLKGDHREAEMYYRKALAISPRFEDAVLNLSAVLYNSGRFQEAHELICRIESRHSDTRYELFLEKIQTALSQ
ncbi:MAG: O-antigen ligase family protein [bacterium]|nr:O-antigen ligase family protein [bacterium]